MSERFRPETVMDAIVAGQLKAATVPLREGDNDDDDETVHTHTHTMPPPPPPPPIEKPVINSSFSGFSDFDLDLSCLSMTNILPPHTPSPPPSPILSRSVSVVRQLRPLTKNPTKRQSSPLLPPMASLSLTRGTWPSSEYTGRGTPIDRTRRSEWGGILGEEVGEDGVLLSSTVVGSGSLDSPNMKPASHRSVSPDWNYVTSSSSPPSLLGLNKKGSTIDEVLELAPIEIKGLSDVVRPDEWDSIMEAVLRPTVLPNGGTLTHPQPQHKGEEENTKVDAEDDKLEPVPEAQPNDVLPLEGASTTVQSEPILDLQAGLDAALDMGLGLTTGRMNLFDLGLLPSTGRDSPSIYSSQSHPLPQRPSSPPTSNLLSDHDHRDSTTSASGKLEGNGNELGRGRGSTSRLGGKVGWRKMFGRMCRLSSVLHMQKGKH